MKDLLPYFNKQQKGLIISGPCSAETEDQVLETANQIAATGKVHLLRAGIWKPRTRPGSFEGVGSEGLQWLQKARQQTGLPVTIEIATAKQVEEALAHHIDVLWIGARTTVNPFSVQEIAEALKGVDIPVLIKNPVNPDLELWAGAVERISKAGIQNIGLVHRGFSTHNNAEYRNAPLWHLAIEMKRNYPQLMMLCDPSHICGRRNILLRVAQKSLNLDYDGLMIESHINPDEAWSDAKQQITPAQLDEMLAQLVWRNPDTAIVSEHQTLEDLRSKIDVLDDELIELLAKRMKVADEIGLYKKKNNITILQQKRWNDIMERIDSKSSELNLSEAFIKKYLEAVHIESINHQNNVME